MSKNLDRTRAIIPFSLDPIIKEMYMTRYARPTLILELVDILNWRQSVQWPPVGGGKTGSSSNLYGYTRTTGGSSRSGKYMVDNSTQGTGVVVRHRWELTILCYHKIMTIYPYPFLVLITQLFSFIIIFIDCICILIFPPVYYLFLKLSFDNQSAPTMIARFVNSL